jgi:hypothetical protein
VLTAADRTSSNVVRITNVYLQSHPLLDAFLSLNDIKNRVDHGTGRLPRYIWTHVAEVVNGASEDDDSPLQLVMSEDDNHRNEIMSMDLVECDVMTATVIRKKVYMLLKG